MILSIKLIFFLVLHDLVSVPNDVIEYHCMFYLVIIRLATSGDTVKKFADNDVGSTVYR